MADIKVKNNANTEVVLKDVNEIVLPTADGGTARFRRYNGFEEITTKVAVMCLNVTSRTVLPTLGEISTTVSVSVTSEGESYVVESNKKITENQYFGEIMELFYICR